MANMAVGHETKLGLNTKKRWMRLRNRWKKAFSMAWSFSSVQLASARASVQTCANTHAKSQIWSNWLELSRALPRADGRIRRPASVNIFTTNLKWSDWLRGVTVRHLRSSAGQLAAFGLAVNIHRLPLNCSVLKADWCHLWASRCCLMMSRDSCRKSYREAGHKDQGF